MAQRFGRVNRFGLRDDTRIHVVHPAPSAFDEKNKLTPFRQKTLALLEQLNGSASPDSLSKLAPDACAEAFAPKPITVATSDILFDTWAMTSIQGQMPGRPHVEPFLHGLSDWEPPQTQIAWRTEVAEVVEAHLLAEYAPEDLLQAYPIKPLEQLADRSDRVFAKLKRLRSAIDVPVWLIDADGKVKRSTLDGIVADDKQSIEGLTLLLPPQAGGLDNGFFNPSAKYDESIAYDVADEWTGPGGVPMRARRWQRPDESASSAPPGMKRLFEIEFRDLLDEDARPERIWHWFVRLSAAEADARSRTSYDLQPHLDDAKQAAMEFVTRLSPQLDAEIQKAVVLAAMFHDLGKDRQRWQNGIGNHDYPQTKWAKSGKRQAIRERTVYRHEFGSMLDIREQNAFKVLSDDAKELVWHLIAAHHGRARPHFTTDEAFDDKYPGDDARDASIEVPRRFARLQRKFGRWGLAYLESLVRAADYAASAKAEGDGK
jgi:CRISPR-associated endonuclease/helicase Cas3